MSLKKLHVGAILIADAHCAPWRTPLIDFLHALESGAIQTTQLVLMGDIFDLLFGPIPRTHHYNTEGIDVLNRLSKRIEILYLEGNHDFRIGELFPDIEVVQRKQQPVRMTFEGKKIALSHGDKAMGRGYELYTALIRNRWILGFLRFIDTLGKGFIVQWLEEMMKKKSHCREIRAFEPLIQNRLALLETDAIDIWIEGHFHQNTFFEVGKIHYINVGAFACNERYFSVQSVKNQPLLHECSFHKEPE
ncbi:MAG: UDP-2,3-diacylglucosamine hydrolase [Sulfuricurvum sp.]|nr:UDP-2,3-diacylglucosamine hydrolase [Sulfuricurvum sp.]